MYQIKISNILLSPVFDEITKFSAHQYFSVYGTYFGQGHLMTVLVTRKCLDVIVHVHV